MDTFKAASSSSDVIDVKFMESFGRNIAYFEYMDSIYNVFFLFSVDEMLICGNIGYRLLEDVERRKPILLQMIGSIRDAE